MLLPTLLFQVLGSLRHQIKAGHTLDRWLPKFDPTNPDQRTVEFISPNRFKNAVGIGIDQKSRDIFVVDAQLDSVAKFNNRGKFKVESFGKKSFGIALNRPGGVAIAENTLYVCDTENNRIVVYRLSTDN